MARVHVPLTEAERGRAEAVFMEHRRYVESVASSRVAPSEVPDVVQAVGVKICTSLNGFRGDSQIRTWLHRITINAAREHFRRERSHVLRPRERLTACPPPDVVVDPDDAVTDAERLNAFQDAMAQLPVKHRRLMSDVLKRSDRNTTHLDNVKLDNRTRAATWRARRVLRSVVARDPRLNGHGTTNPSDD